MNKIQIKEALNGLSKSIAEITDTKTADILRKLMNLVEVLAEQNAKLEESNQKLRDENNRLKGEQGKPNIRGKNKNQNTDHSSENERKNREPKNTRKPKTSKKSTVKIDREVTRDIDSATLPEDAIFKGYETRVIQDISITTDNIQFNLKSYYSPSLKKTFIAPLPTGYHGEFGPRIKALVITQYRVYGMTISAISKFYDNHGILISEFTISTMLTEKHEAFHQEKNDIVQAGLQACPYQHIDDTGCRVNGENHYAHILCNPFFTAFFTRPKKNRLTLLSILCQGDLKFTVNDDAYALMAKLGLPDNRLNALKEKSFALEMTEQDIDAMLLQFFPNPEKHATYRRIIKESAAIVYYQASDLAIDCLMSDDAPQFNKIAKHKALCWIHVGRHFKKMNPVFSGNKKILNDFLDQFWDYYSLLLKYKEDPSSEQAQRLLRDFEVLFSTKTGYDSLDKRIGKILEKRNSLLLILDFPFLPLHNNPAELGARVQARIRDINLHTISNNGTQTKDTFATIVQTAKKLGVNIYDYIYDRVAKKYQMTSLADMILQKSAQAP